jgi:D-beta-D-heptose 7-phosphate kinase/D-beta-D-heptose 1-phosphate adenosyltransferase
VTLVGVIGRDAAGEALRRSLDAAGIAVDGLVEDSTRPTIEKVRIVTGTQSAGRAASTTRRTATSRASSNTASPTRWPRRAQGARALVVSDYLKGSITANVMQALLRRKRPDVPLLVDPKIPHLACYAGATLITPNHHEAEHATNRRIRT